jgi:hypothetical protein
METLRSTSVLPPSNQIIHNQDITCETLTGFLQLVKSAIFFVVVVVGDMAQVVEYLPSKFKALSSKFSTATTKEKKKRKKRLFFFS